MKRLLLVLILTALLLTACQPVPVQPDYYPAQEPEQQLQPVIEPEPEQEPEPISPENWPAHFAALVEGMGEELDEWSCISGFHLMDITHDGVPELIVEVSLHMGAGPFLFVLRWDTSAEEASLLQQNPTWSGLPLRFFQNDQTGEIIYSSLASDHSLRGIIYRFTETLDTFRVVTCNGANNHALGGVVDGGTEWEAIEEFVVTPDLMDWVGCDCGIQYGRNSPDPTIVYLVNLALEGFTEIPASTRYTFEGLEFSDMHGHYLFTADQVGAVQEWIFEVAENWGA